MALIFERSVILLVSLAILLALCGCGNSDEIKANLPGLDRWYVHVVNGLGGSRPVLVHCKSKDNDLGARTLTTGTEFSWNFKTSYFGKTRFWCFWNNGQGHANYDVFWEEKDHQWLHDHCYPQDCFWIAKDDGIYLKNNRQNTDDLVHKWEQGRVYCVVAVEALGRQVPIASPKTTIDLGTHDLEPGSEFNWTFKTSYFGKTLCWCYLHNNIHNADFDAFWEEKRHQWLHDRCSPNNCIWIAKDDGIYLKNNPQNHDELIHKWEQGWKLNL